MTKTLLALINLRPSGGEKKLVAVRFGVSDVAWLRNCPVSNTFLMHSDLEGRPPPIICPWKRSWVAQVSVSLCCPHLCETQRWPISTWTPRPLPPDILITQSLDWCSTNMYAFKYADLRSCISVKEEETLGYFISNDTGRKTSVKPWLTFDSQAVPLSWYWVSLSWLCLRV